MASSSMKRLLNSRANYIHISAPLVQVEMPKQSKPRNGFRMKQSQAVDSSEMELVTIVHPHKSSRVTRVGQGEAKRWIRQKTQEVKEFLKNMEKNPDIEIASFFFFEETKSWKVGLFKSQAQDPYQIFETETIAEALEKVAEQTPEFVSFFRVEDMEQEPLENYPELRFIVNG